MPRIRGPLQPIYRTIANNIQRHRWDQDITQQELGDKCGMWGSVICSFERADRRMRVDVLERVARGLGVPLVELLKEEHDAR